MELTLKMCICSHNINALGERNRSFSKLKITST